MEEHALHPYSVRDAARLLGISGRAVRFRMESGKLTGTQIDGKWMVYLPSDEGRKETEEGRNTGSDYIVEGNSAEEAFPPPRQSVSRPPEQMQMIMNEWLAPLTAKISDQAEEIGRLKAEVVQKTHEAEALAASLDAISLESPESEVRGFWARLFGG